MMPLYFDNHATTPIDPRVLEAMLPYFREDFGNAESGQHAYGWKAKAAVEKARGQVAALLNAEANEILFTSGATESIHSAILGFLSGLGAEARHIVTVASEHKATLEVCERARKQGHTLTVLPVDPEGRITLAQVESALRPETALVSVMHANNEIGTIHDIGAIGQLLRSREIFFHVDAAQTAGKTPIDVKAMNIDLLSISAHKLYGPKGAGALFVRRSSPRVPLHAYIVGGGQERGLRGGTQNVPGIVGLGEACAIAQAAMAEEGPRLARWRDKIINALLEALPNARLNGPRADRLCNNVNLTLQGIAGDTLTRSLSDIAYSSASACSTGGPSHVLMALGCDTDDPMATTVRFGLGRFNSENEVDTLIRRLVETVAQGDVPKAR